MHVEGMHGTSNTPTANLLSTWLIKAGCPYHGDLGKVGPGASENRFTFCLHNTVGDSLG